MGIEAYMAAYDTQTRPPLLDCAPALLHTTIH